MVLPPGAEELELGSADPVADAVLDDGPVNELLGPEELFVPAGPELDGDFELLGLGAALTDDDGNPLVDGESDTDPVLGRELDVPLLGRLVGILLLLSEDVTRVRALDVGLSVSDTGEDSGEVLVLVELRLAGDEAGPVLAPVSGLVIEEDSTEDCDEGAELSGPGGPVDARVGEPGLSEGRPELGASPLDVELGPLKPVGPVPLGEERPAGPVVALILVDSVEAELTVKVATSVVVSSVICVVDSLVAMVVTQLLVMVLGM